MTSTQQQLFQYIIYYILYYSILSNGPVLWAIDYNHIFFVAVVQPPLHSTAMIQFSIQHVDCNCKNVLIDPQSNFIMHKFNYFIFILNQISGFVRTPGSWKVESLQRQTSLTVTKNLDSYSLLLWLEPWMILKNSKPPFSSYFLSSWRQCQSVHYITKTSNFSCVIRNRYCPKQYMFHSVKSWKHI
jgi:hypothetical protein